jgi:hypothetical protein
VKRLFFTLGFFLLSGAFTQVLRADVAGVWTGRIVYKSPDRGDQPRDVTLTLKVDGYKVTGTLSGTWEGHRDSAEILDGKVGGDVVFFAVPSGATDMPRIEFVGKQDGDNLTLTITDKNPNNGKERPAGDGLLKRSK